ncbi:MAG TPA: SBBP repeat-containing protein [Bryobacteraceae bacterium]|nr:SBBP repeat-containing protein [Bryobacteraceae bacterium]
MFRGLVALAVLTALRMPASVELLPQLPNSAVSNAIQLDPAGNIYVAGSFAPASVLDTANAFVAKLSPDGSQLFYFTVMAGSQADGATALALGPDGSAYVAGYTASSDFPVTAGALDPTYTGQGQNQGFLVKVNPSGAVVYSSFINGPAITQLTGIALDSSGEVFLTGIGGPGYSVASEQAAQGFVLKLSAALNQVQLSLYGYGGGLIDLDSQGNIYLAGSAQANVLGGSTGPVLTLPALPSGAFQPTHAARFCLTLGSGPGGVGGSESCRYQYIAKLNPAGTALWATYVTGTYGAIARGMAVDSSGNVIVAGTTYSDDYPVTPGVFQPAYAAAAPPFPAPPGSTYSGPPPASGYVTKLSAGGTALIWSTYFGGTFSDEITGMAVTPTGEIVLSGRAGSRDLPAVSATPAACLPLAGQELGFVVRLSPDGTTAGPAQLVEGAPDCLYFSCPVISDFPAYVASWPLALRADGTVLVAGTNGTVASIDFSSASRLACFADPADYAQLRTLAPGQVLALFGTDLAPAAPFAPSDGVAPSSASLGVTFDGIPAPILYAAADQINVQVPYEIAGQSSVQMQVVDTEISLPLSETATLGVAPLQPAAFLASAALFSPFPGYTVCGGTVALGMAALAINQDGTVNDCSNPAVGGSTVTFFVDGLGPVTPALATGAIATAALKLTPAVAVLDSSLAPVRSTTRSLPGSITGVAQVQVLLPAVSGPTAPYAFTPKVNGTGFRERLLVVWVRSQ